MKQRRTIICRLFATLMMAQGILCLQGQTAAAPAMGPQAVKYVLTHFNINGDAADPNTHRPLQMDGSWSISRARPATCPSSERNCVEVFYAETEQAAKCSWVISLDDSGANGTVLDENDDAAKYMVRAIGAAQAKPYVKSRSKPVYPPIAMVANVGGVVTLWALVDTSGTVQKVGRVSGPAMLQATSIEAAKKWRFVPMTIGTRAVPYEAELAFTFQVVRPEWTIVRMTP